MEICFRAQVMTSENFKSPMFFVCRQYQGLGQHFSIVAAPTRALVAELNTCTDGSEDYEEELDAGDVDSNEGSSCHGDTLFEELSEGVCLRNQFNTSSCNQRRIKG